MATPKDKKESEKEDQPEKESNSGLRIDSDDDILEDPSTLQNQFSSKHANNNFQSEIQLDANLELLKYQNKLVEQPNQPPDELPELTSLSNFSSKDVKHIKNVKNGKVYRYTYVQVRCEICRKTCLSDSALKRHKLKVHGIPIENCATIGSKKTNTRGKYSKRIEVLERENLILRKLGQVKNETCLEPNFDDDLNKILENKDNKSGDNMESLFWENSETKKQDQDASIPVSKPFKFDESLIESYRLDELTQQSGIEPSNDFIQSAPNSDLNQPTAVSFSDQPPSKVTKYEDFDQPKHNDIDLEAVQTQVLQNLIVQSLIQNVQVPQLRPQVQPKQANFTPPSYNITTLPQQSSSLENSIITNLIQKISEFHPNTPIEDVLSLHLQTVSEQKRKTPTKQVKTPRITKNMIGRDVDPGQPKNPDIKTITNIKNGKVYKYTYLQVKCDICKKTCLSENALKRHKIKYHNLE